MLFLQYGCGCALGDYENACQHSRVLGQEAVVIIFRRLAETCVPHSLIRLQ